MAGCTQARHGHVPRQADAVSQYFYARHEWYEPAMRQRGDERARLLRLAVDGFAAVALYFPADESVTTRSLASYYQGLCHLDLGETDRARQDFIHCRDLLTDAERAPAHGNNGERMHAAGHATLRALAEAARHQMHELDRLGR